MYNSVQYHNNYLDFNILQTGSLYPFRSVFPRARFILPACVYPYFSAHDGYDFLPFKHVDLYRDGVSPDSYLILAYLGVPVLPFLV
jgi:hypothetical protein